ncbi:hypothetical protein C427_1034 [Paraglaciecola psychrophila 170]|uniref:Uncharacterized protein n=1 Tax=Paraglaciecola psychrophila 170 TaxID=1129794 RepID=K6ZSF4_9ALTE|nr:hypothetical protein C427_1034 [Paraglaciecola psychrophila 170]GAC38826.1 hypothetical protein GPSY_3215 [Paraglaciecola psychrophila 170]
MVSGTKRGVKEVETMTGKRWGKEVKQGEPVGYALRINLVNFDLPRSWTTLFCKG